MSIGVDAPAVPQAMGAGAGAGRRPALDPAWYDAIACGTAGASTPMLI